MRFDAEKININSNLYHLPKHKGRFTLK